MAIVAQEEVWLALHKAGIEWGEMTPYVQAAQTIRSQARGLESSILPAAEYVAHVATATGCAPEMVPSILRASARLLEEIA